MIKIYLTVAGSLMFVGLGLYSATARAQCSAEDISSYVQSGATPEQLSQLCGQQDGGGYQPYASPASPAASVCATQWGICQLAEQLPVGSACVCYTQADQLPGIAR